MPLTLGTQLLKSIAASIAAMKHLPLNCAHPTAQTHIPSDKKYPSKK